MNTKKNIVVIVLILSFIGCNAQNIKMADTSNLKARYLGQKPPGRKAIAFAPDVLGSVHDSPLISQDETWIIVGTMEQEVISYEMINRELSLSTNPLKFDLPFCGDNDSGYYHNGMEISRSEKKIYFLIWHNNDEDFYFIEKTDDGWTPPKPLGEELNSISTHWQFTVATNENLYLMVRGKGICVSVFDGISHLKPIQLSLEDGGNMEGSTPFIAGDESYIIYSLNNNLHISYNLNNGKWTMPIDIGPDINSNAIDHCPRVSPNGKYMFFTSRRAGGDFATYWVSADFIEKLNPKKAHSQ